jgi:hypothetical protein
MFGVRKAVHVPPLVFMKDRVAGRAQRQIIAERVNNFVAAIKRYRGGQRDLVRPSAVYSGRGYTMPEWKNAQRTASISRAMAGVQPGNVLDIASAMKPLTNGRADCSGAVPKNESRAVIQAAGHALRGDEEARDRSAIGQI